MFSQSVTQSILSAYMSVCLSVFFSIFLFISLFCVSLFVFGFVDESFFNIIILVFVAQESFQSIFDEDLYNTHLQKGKGMTKA